MPVPKTQVSVDLSATRKSGPPEILQVESLQDTLKQEGLELCAANRACSFAHAAGLGYVWWARLRMVGFQHL